jgi:hypothetical protein
VVNVVRAKIHFGDFVLRVRKPRYVRYHFLKFTRWDYG